MGYYAAWGGLEATFRDYISVPKVVPKRRSKTASGRVIIQKKEEFKPESTWRKHSVHISGIQAATSYLCTTHYEGE